MYEVLGTIDERTFGPFVDCDSLIAGINRQDAAEEAVKVYAGRIPGQFALRDPATQRISLHRVVPPEPVSPTVERVTL